MLFNNSKTVWPYVFFHPPLNKLHFSTILNNFLTLQKNLLIFLFVSGLPAGT
jgi:hypothetical protein